jgi:hypothetical protein
MSATEEIVSSVMLFFETQTVDFAMTSIIDIIDELIEQLRERQEDAVMSIEKEEGHNNE